MAATGLSIEARRYQAGAFLTALFKLKPATAVIMVTQEGRWHEATGYLSVGPIVERTAARPDFYCGACALVRKPGKGSRGRAAEAVFLPGAWADVDINGSPIRGSTDTVTGHAPSREAALAAIRALAEPTLIVNSGYGLQPWWLLERGFVMHNAREQMRAERAVRGLQRRLEHEAGWKVDATADLARVMRVPGTLNTKAEEPAPVWMLPDVGPRYTLERLEQLAGDLLQEHPPTRAAVPVEEWARRVHDGADIGERHERIWQITGYLLRCGLDPAISYEIVSAFNAARVRPPYDERTVRKHFDGILRLETQRRRQQRARFTGTNGSGGVAS